MPASGAVRAAPAAGGAGAFFPHWRDVLVEAAKEWVNDRAMTLGSSLAYYTLFSMAPLILFAVALAGFIFGADEARAGVLDELRLTLGDDVAGAIDAVLQNADKAGATTVTVFGVVVLLFGASGAFVELQGALNQIWKAEGAPTSGVWSFVRTRLLSISAVVGMGFLLLVSLVLSSALSIVGRFAGAALAWQAVNVVVSLGMITLVFAMVYRLLPDAEVRWSDVWGGALVAAALVHPGQAAVLAVPGPGRGDDDVRVGGVGGGAALVGVLLVADPAVRRGGPRTRGSGRPAGSKAGRNEDGGGPPPPGRLPEATAWAGVMDRRTRDDRPGRPARSTPAGWGRRPFRPPGWPR
ncbi:MAG: YihY/virulence factor BrkB family protein [Gemmataceae bacterium]